MPIGTSKNTLSHLQYAVDFAEAFGAKLYVVHIYKVFTKAGTMINLDHRITSYDVCYTKLLRFI